MNNLLLVIFFLGLMFCSFTAIAYVGEVDFFEGKVNVYKANEVRGTDVKTPKHSLNQGDRVRTYTGSKAFITIGDLAKIVLLEKSVLTVDSTQNFLPTEGKIVFDINKVNQAKGVQIGLQTTIIGVKGTTFLISIEPEDGEEGLDITKIYLKEGTVSVISTEDEGFKKYSNEILSEYQNFVDDVMSDYDDYLSELENEFFEYTKEFDLKSGNAISIDGNIVKNIAFDDDVNNAFQELEQFDTTIVIKSSKQEKKYVRPPFFPQYPYPPLPYPPYPYPHPSPYPLKKR